MNRIFADLSPGTYSFAEVDLPLNWELMTLTCSGDRGGLVTTTDLQNRSISIGLDGGEAIICTFGNKFNEELHRLKTKKIIYNFIGRRLWALLASIELDRARFVRRLPGALWGENWKSVSTQTPVGAFSLSGMIEQQFAKVAFATSLDQIEQATANDSNGESLQSLSFSDRADGQPRLKNNSNSDMDVWLEGHYNSSSDTETTSFFGLLTLGADYLIKPSILVGALIQRDWMKVKSRNDQSKVRGAGTMAGPYISTRLTPNLFFDARAAWGTSNNTVNPFGQYNDEFSTKRWLANARLTGNVQKDDYRITPSISLSYIEDRQESYTDEIGVFIPGQTVALGRFTFGPEIAHIISKSNGSSYELQLSMAGMWDFDSPDIRSSTGLNIGYDKLHARLEAAIQYLHFGGRSFRISGSYGGIGAGSYESFGLHLTLNMP